MAIRVLAVSDEVEPAALPHGHVHPGRTRQRTAGITSVCNVTGWRLLDITPGGLADLQGGYRHAL